MASIASPKSVVVVDTIEVAMEPSQKWLARRVAALCESRSQVEIGKITHLGQGAIGRVARGEGNQTLKTLDAIAAGVRVPAWALIRPIKDEDRTALEDRAMFIIEAIPDRLLPRLLSILEGLQDISAPFEQGQNPSKRAK